MCVETSVLPWPASGPASAMSLPIRPLKCASAASLLSLSHSRPRPASGAGWLSLPVDVWPSRRTSHLPGGHVPGDPAVACPWPRQVHDSPAGDGHSRPAPPASGPARHQVLRDEGRLALNVFEAVARGNLHLADPQPVEPGRCLREDECGRTVTRPPESRAVTTPGGPRKLATVRNVRPSSETCKAPRVVMSPCRPGSSASSERAVIGSRQLELHVLRLARLRPRQRQWRGLLRSKSVLASTAWPSLVVTFGAQPARVPRSSPAGWGTASTAMSR